MKKWRPLLLPVVVYVVLAATLVLYDGAQVWVNYPSFLVLPYLLLAVSFFLGVFFQQSRISFLSIFLGVIIFYLDRTCVTEGLLSKSDAIIFLSSIYVPAFGVLFYHLGERGMLTVKGYVRFVIILSGILVVVLVPNIADMSKAVSSTNMMLFSPPLECVRIPLTGWLVLFVCMPFFCFRSGFESPLLGYFFCIAILFVFAGLNMSAAIWPDGASRAVLFSFMSGAALTFTCAIMESSWRNANIDELTELPGRRSFKHNLERLGDRYVIAMVDVDHFKKVNDRYGHSTGDQVLRFIASFLRYNQAGKAYRYGGEEFAIVCEDGELKKVVEQLEELRQAICGREFIVRSRTRPRKADVDSRKADVTHDKTITITVSIGVAQSGQAFFSPQDVVHAADKALYRAKKAGRNQVRTSMLRS